MTVRGYLGWLGAGVVLAIAAWWLSRRIASPAARLGLRCLGVATALTPQPLWIPGEGGAVVPALLMLLSGRVTMGAFPILAAATMLFVVAGWRMARTTTGPERLVHQAARRWVVLGVVLPLLALVVISPFLAFFALGGPLALWGIPSLVVLGVGVALDWRAAALPGAPQSRRLRHATWLLAMLLAVVALAALAWRRLGWV